MIYPLLLGVSVFGMVLQNSIWNYSSKGFLKDGKGIAKFNAEMYIVSFLLFLALAFTGGISIYTVILALMYGFSTVIASTYRLKALSIGPMHITTLVTTASMIIPSLSGVFICDEELSISKLIAIFALLFFVFFALDKGENMKINKKWVIYCGISFVFLGMIGVLQKIHQTSIHREELFAFLAISFFASLIFALPKALKNSGGKKFTLKENIFALICGVTTFAVNLINLKLSGVLPSQLFFPIVNGVGIILSSISAKVIFKEKFTVRQIVGLVGGIASLILICLL